jgi:hypothetical protein
MSTAHATRAPGDIVAIPEALLPALRSGAMLLAAPLCEDLASSILGDEDEDHQTAVRVELEELLATIRALGAKGTVALPGTVMAPIVDQAIFEQTERVTRAAEARTVEAFDEIERTSALVRRLRIFEHELRATGKAA